MIIEIDDTKNVSDLQERFSFSFPSLKLEFCPKKHGWEDICPENKFYSGDTSIASIRKIHDPGTLNVNSWNKVGEVEKEFYKKFGLSVQIFYRCGQRWIQTGKSDNLTIDSLQEKTYKYPKVGLL
jgi:hypothetical protein